MPKTDLLIRTKLRLPFTRSELVPRPRLQEQIAQGLRGPLTLVIAPAGFGKTTLVAACVATCGMPVAWLSLDKHDDEAGRFLNYVAAALQEADNMIGSEAAQLMAEVQQTPPETVLTSLINDIDFAGREIALVLDDYQFISSQAIHEAVAFLLDHCPNTFHLVIATRSDPPLPLARLRARAQTVELRAADLRFTAPEATQFLNDVMGLHLDTRSVVMLEERTEGWIAGLQMAALSMQGRSDPETFVRAFSGSHRYVLDYLMEEVLHRQRDPVQRFLLQTSLLERMNAALCAALLGTETVDSAQAMLELLERENLFIIPLDDDRCYYRYHHLFAELLRVKLTQTCPDSISSLHRRAANWHAEQALWDDAIRHAFLANDPEYAADLFERATIARRDAFLFSGIAELVEQFPESFVRQRPLVALGKATIMFQQSQLNGILPLLRIAEQGVRENERLEGWQPILGTIHILQGAVASLLGDISLLLEASQQASALLSENDADYANTLLQSGLVHYFSGEFHRVDEIWMRALEVGRKSGDVYMTLLCMADLAFLKRHKGELPSAESLIQQIEKLAGSHGNRYLQWIGSARRDYSDVLRERNQLDEAHRTIGEAITICEKYDTISSQGLGHIHLGRILLAQGDLPGAAEALHHAQHLAATHTLYPDLLALIRVFEILLMLTQKQDKAALQISEACAAEPWWEHELLREWLEIARARCLLHLGQMAEAVALISCRRDVAHLTGRGRNWLEMTLLIALAKTAQGEQSLALALLQDALVFAQAQGFVRIFLDESQPMQSLLAQWLAHAGASPARDYALRLLSQFEAEPHTLTATRETTSSIGNLIEPLSERESEVLQLIATGKTNQEIAQQLIVSPGTVKAHTASIYRKLDVANRTEAVARARQLGILS